LEKVEKELKASAVEATELSITRDKLTQVLSPMHGG